MIPKSNSSASARSLTRRRAPSALGLMPVGDVLDRAEQRSPPAAVHD